MNNKPYRVVVWATGGIGSIAIRAIQRRPDLELVGVWVHSQEKVGKDVGELANSDPIGLVATNDAEALIALKPDCVVYAASGPERDALAIPDYVKLLEAGINVVTTSTTRLVNPHLYEPAEWRDQLVAAATRGRCRCMRRVSSQVSPPTTYRWCCRHSRRRSRRFTRSRSGCTTTTAFPTS
jgi:hypothetical protein